MSPQTVTAVTGPGALFVCRCCGDHDDMPLVWGPPAICPICGDPCSCAGCHADAEGAGS